SHELEGFGEVLLVGFGLNRETQSFEAFWMKGELTRPKPLLVLEIGCAARRDHAEGERDRTRRHGEGRPRALAGSGRRQREVPAARGARGPPASTRPGRGT